MLTTTDLGEMRALFARVQQGSVSRKDWAALAALTLISQGAETVAAIAAGGLDAFIGITEPIYQGHAFRRSDYQRIFDRICLAADRARVTH